MSLKVEIRKLLKLGDTEYMPKSLEFKAECVSRGISIEKVRHLIRVCIHENSKPETMPEPESPQPVAPEPPQALPDSRTESELSRRVQFSGEPVRERSDSESKILMMADNKGLSDVQ
jgi:hypothetical protein